MKLIAISGKKQSGKDTVADMLVKRAKVCNCKISFALALRVEVANACRLRVEDIDAHKENFRLILQGWGTDFRRNYCDTNYWLKRMDLAIKEMNELGVELLIIPDVRFFNELEYCKKLGALTIRVERPGLPVDNHQSEIELDHSQFDYVIRNDKTLFELECLVNQIPL